MLDFVLFEDNIYPVIKVSIEGYESELMISTEDLEIRAYYCGCRLYLYERTIDR